MMKMPNKAFLYNFAHLSAFMVGGIIRSTPAALQIKVDTKWRVL